MNRWLPLFEDGLFIPNPEDTTLGFMLFPNCQRSAHQVAQLMVDEIRAKKLDPGFRPGQLLEIVQNKLPMALLNLVGDMAIRVFTNATQGKEVSISKAAWVISERNATNTTLEGKPLPTSERRLREHFKLYRPVIHLWAASRIAHVHKSGELDEFNPFIHLWLDRPRLVQFLAHAAIVQSVLQEALDEPNFWSVPSELASHLDPKTSYGIRYIGDHPSVAEALGSYSARSGS